MPPRGMHTCCLHHNETFAGRRRCDFEGMARIHPKEDLAPKEIQDLPGGEQVTRQTQTIFAHRPDQAQAVFDLMGAVEAGTTLDGRLIELVRLRIAFWNQCRSCMSLRYRPDEVSEGLVCSLERPEEADDLTDRGEGRAFLRRQVRHRPPDDRRRDLRRAAPVLRRGRAGGAGHRLRCLRRLRPARGDLGDARASARELPGRGGAVRSLGRRRPPLGRGSGQVSSSPSNRPARRQSSQFEKKVVEGK